MRVSPVLIVRNMYLCLVCAGVTGVDRKEHVLLPGVCWCHQVLGLLVGKDLAAGREGHDGW